MTSKKKKKKKKESVSQTTTLENAYLEVIPEAAIDVFNKWQKTLFPC